MMTSKPRDDSGTATATPARRTGEAAKCYALTRINQDVKLSSATSHRKVLHAYR